MAGNELERIASLESQVDGLAHSMTDVTELTKQVRELTIQVVQYTTVTKRFISGQEQINSRQERLQGILDERVRELEIWKERKDATMPTNWLDTAAVEGRLGALERGQQKHIAADDTPLRWINRVRRMMPLRNPEARFRGVNWILEVSEDAGETFRRIELQIVTLKDQCGFMLQIDNPAAINYESIVSGAKADTSDSWWKMLKDGTNLRFRITCCIPADQAIMALAQWQSSSGSRFVRGQYLPVEVEELWIQGQTTYNNLTTYKRVFGLLPNGATVPADEVSKRYVKEIEGPAKRRRDALEDARLSLSVNTFLMDLERYHIGQRVKGISGREHSFKQNRGNEDTYPNIVGITIKLGSIASQAIEIQLEDQAFAPVR